MRKAMLVVAMVAASFAGGAVVNGAGLAWVRALLGLDPVRVGPLDPADPAAGPNPALAPPTVEVADDAPTAVEPLAPSPTPAPASREREPLAPSPIESPAPSAVEPGPETVAPSPLDSGAAASPEAAASPGSQPLDQENSPPPLAPPSLAMEVEEAAPAPAPLAKAAPSKPVEPGWGDAPGSAPPTAFLPEPRGAKAKPRIDPAVAPASLPAPAAVPSPAPNRQAAPSSPEPVRPAAVGWAAIRQGMTTRNVSKFWIEGEPGGAVRFRCVVPLAGRGAVAQQFEAEADDVLVAAEAALRRIDLWRATESSPSPSPSPPSPSQP